MNDLPNLDHYDDLERGDVPEQVGATAPTPSDTATVARCLLPLLAISGVFRGCDCPQPCEVCKCSQ